MNSPSIFYPDLIPHMVIEKLVNRAPKVPLDLKGPSRVFSCEDIKNEFSTLTLPGFDTSHEKKY